MAQTDRWLENALARQLDSREGLLSAGAAHVGWKLGMGEPERRGGEPVIGHLTSATEFQPDGRCEVRRLIAPHADAEIAIQLRTEIAPDVSSAEAAAAIGGWGPALEICDLGNASAGSEEVVATNVFHRAFATGPFIDAPPMPLVGRLLVDGVERDSNLGELDYGAMLVRVAQLLSAFGLRLRAGDRLITGSVVQVPVGPSREVVADFGSLGRVTVQLD